MTADIASAQEAKAIRPTALALLRHTRRGISIRGISIAAGGTDIPTEIVRRVCNEGPRDYETPCRSGDAV